MLNYYLKLYKTNTKINDINIYILIYIIINIVSILFLGIEYRQIIKRLMNDILK